MANVSLNIKYFKKLAKDNLPLFVMSKTFLFILAILPFATLLSVWAGSTFGYIEVFRAFKEIVLLLLIPFAVWLFMEDRRLTQKIFKNRINQLILFYAGINILMWAFRRGEADAAIASIMFNLRWLVVFVWAQIIAHKLPKGIRDLSIKIVLITGGAIAIFATLQVLFLPGDFLTHFGFGPETIEPYLTIDANESFPRVNGSLRGPNPLGAYMVILLSLSAWVYMKWKKWRPYILTLIPFILISLYGSQSRSAWVATVVAISVFTFVYVWRNKPKLKKIMLSALASLLVLMPVTYFAIKDTDFYQFRILHNDPSDKKHLDSNTSRINSYKRAISSIVKNPLGDGPGTSGHASNYSSKPRFSENYYLQVAQELGIAGLAVLLGILILVGWNLWRQTDLFGLSLLASFMGLLTINLFLLSWNDDVITMSWWALAGLYLARV